MKNELLEDEKSFAFVTCGDWDLKTMLPNQCRTSKCSKPKYFSQWINIKRVRKTLKELSNSLMKYFF